MPYVSDSVFNNPGIMSDTGDSRYPYWRPNGYDSDPDIARVQQETDLMNAWSADQAFQNRLWQEEMSNTAHQREVADLKAAGLNPVLSANSGASTPNGSYATADSSSVSAIKDIAVTQAQALSALALMQARGSGSGFGANGYYGKNAWEKMFEDLIEGYAGTDAQSAMRNAGKWIKGTGVVDSVVSAAKNVAATVARLLGHKPSDSDSSSAKGGRDGKWWTPW